MKIHYKNASKEACEIQKIFEPNFPMWLVEYIETPEMQKQARISMTCGTIYSDLFPESVFYSSLDHSVGVALIVWHFTHDKKQTLAGLFHDIATPAFKHCVDFMNGDYMTQESTEELTTEMIKGSKSIMKLLRRDGIEVSEVDDYHKYPIADNDTPQLSADRLEYSLSNSLFEINQSTIERTKYFYDDLEVQTNSDGEPELGFKTKKCARDFVKATSKMSVFYRDDSKRYSMQLVADILKNLSEDGKISVRDLYELSEAEVIKIIEDSKYRNAFEIWKNAKEVKTSSVKPSGVYYVHHGAKVRYIDPLVKGERISKICKIAKKYIDKNLAYDMSNYVYLDGIKADLL